MPTTPVRPLRFVFIVLGGALLLSACAHESSSANAAATHISSCPDGAANDGIQSYDLLCREPVANRTRVKHILIGWKDLGTPSHPLDPRAVERTYAEAEALVRELLQKLQSGAAVEPLMEQYSEDPGSARSGQAYDASPDANLVFAFKSLSLRLQVGEVGIVKSSFGFHVIKRVQ